MVGMHRLDLGQAVAVDRLVNFGTLT